MKIKKLINEFNRQDTYLIISDYPEKSVRGQKNYGIAWHTKEIIDPIAKRYGVKFIVLAEKGYDNTPKTYQNGNILVLRVFDQKHPSLFPVILKWLIKFNHVRYVQVHSEFCANGGVKNLILLLPFLALIKLNRKHLTYFAHNVITNLKSVAPHLNISKNSLKYKIFNNGFAYYYKTLGLMVDQFVVMDEAIEKRLSTFVNKNKIFLNPFWVGKTSNKYTYESARDELKIKNGEVVLLYFGFITYYKGADWIIKTIKELRKKKEFEKVRLILAGGKAYSLKDKAYYKKYYENLIKSVKDEPSITITGFVPEEKIEMYFKASNLTVFCYRGLIGASGSLIHAIKYNKPLVLSRSMKEILENGTAQDAIFLSGVSKNNLIFNYTTSSFEKVLRNFINDKNYSDDLEHFSINFAQLRSQKKLMHRCYENLYAISNKTKIYMGKTIAAASSN